MAWDDDADWLPTNKNGEPITHFRFPNQPANLYPNGKPGRRTHLSKSSNPTVRILARWFLDCPTDMPTNMAAHAGFTVGLAMASQMDPDDLYELMQDVNGRGVVPDDVWHGLADHADEIATDFLNGEYND